MTDELHMVRLELDARRLVRLAQRAGLPLHALDTAYAVHCALGELFGELAPAPFALPTEQRRQSASPASPDARRGLPVLGYVRATGTQLREQARLQALPDAYEACDWNSFATKPLPSTWRAGQVLGFEVRLCPIVRTKHPGERELRVKKGRSVSREVDAFLHACWQAGDDASGTPVQLDRQQVYLDWLSPLLTRGGARMLGGEMIRGQREVLWRRRQSDGVSKRTSHRIERPDITVDGRLEVTDPVAFAGLLERGVGRHRAFGFGMLLVRPG